MFSCSLPSPDFFDKVLVNPDFWPSRKMLSQHALMLRVLQSAEDIELRDRLALLVERVKEADQGVTRNALNTMR